MAGGERRGGGRERGAEGGFLCYFLLLGYHPYTYARYLVLPLAKISHCIISPIHNRWKVTSDATRFGHLSLSLCMTKN